MTLPMAAKLETESFSSEREEAPYRDGRCVSVFLPLLFPTSTGPSSLSMTGGVEGRRCRIYVCGFMSQHNI